MIVVIIYWNKAFFLTKYQVIYWNMWNNLYFFSEKTQPYLTLMWYFTLIALEKELLMLTFKIYEKCIIVYEKEILTDMLAQH